MNKKQCYSRGFNTGYEMAKSNEQNLLSCGKFDEAMIEQFIADTCTSETEYFRQYSPFEIFANQINNSHDPDSLWAEYDNGVSDGVQRRIAEFKREHKDSYIGDVE